MALQACPSALLEASRATDTVLAAIQHLASSITGLCTASWQRRLLRLYIMWPSLSQVLTGSETNKEVREMEMVKSDDDWRAELSDLAFKVARPSNGPSCRSSHDDFPEKPAVCSACVCCDAPVFDAEDEV